MSRASTIPEALLATAAADGGVYVFHLDEGEARLTCAELAERAQAGAERLHALGVRPGEAVGVLGRNRPEWVVSAFAVWIAGAALAPLQVPVRIRDRVAYAEQLDRVLGAADCRRVLAEPALASLLPPGVAVPWDGDGPGGGEVPPPPPDATAVIQFTSGSTATPRGAIIPHEAALAQTEILDQLVSGPAGPRTSVHWVPFSHDMGLFLTVLTPTIWGGTCHYLPTERFARDPAEWFRLVEATEAALILGPSTAFGSTLRTVARHGEHPDLSSLEMTRLVAEAVDPDVAERLLDVGPRLGLRPQALGSGYGLAEGVLAVTLTTPGAGLTLDRISIDALATDGVAVPAGGRRARTIASSGPQLRTQVKVAGADGSELSPRRVGEILLRGPSMMSGYMGAEAPDPFVDGWLRTGDLGYMADGELYVTGRVKDMVIVMGDNYYPEDFEWAAGRVEGVRPGRCVAFAKPGAEEVVILVEPSEDGDPRALETAVKNAAADAVGVPPGEVVVLPPGSVRKTTSGKLRRGAMRDAYLSRALGAVTPASGSR